MGLIVLAVFVFFYPVWLHGLVPIPADFIVGVYYPWLDYKWLGYLAGVPVKNPLLADVPSLIYPVRVYAMELLRQGEFPLWNPLQFGGYPLLATFQSAVLYPLNLLFLFFEGVTAWTIQVIFQPFLIAAFTYLFLRQIGISRLASLIGSIIFAFSGFNTIWLEYNVHGHVAAIIPLALYLTDKFIETRSIRWGVLLSIAFAAQIFAGYPQVTFYTAVLVVAWAGFKNSLYVVLFGFLGGFLAAVQIVPGVELLLLSQRTVEGVAGGFEAIFLQWGQLITLFAPDYFGNPTTRNYWGAGDYTNTVGYTGVVSFILAGFSVFWLKKREVRFFLFLALAALVLALPTPLSIFLFSSGFLGIGAATATRVLVLFNLSVAVLAAIALDRFEELRSFKKIIRILYVPTIFLIGFGIATSISWLSFEALKVITPWLNNTKVGLRNLVLPVLFTGLTGMLLFAWFKLKRFDTLFKLVFLFLVAFELFRFGWKFTPFSQREFLYPKTPVFEFLQQQEEPFRMVGGDVIPISMWIPYGLESPAGYDAVYPIRWAKLISVINSGNPAASPMGRYGAVERYDLPLLDLTNTKYLMALKFDKKGIVTEEGRPSYEFDSEKLEPVFEDKSVVILENKNVLPRAILVTRWEETGADEILEKLITPDFPAKEIVLLEENFDDFEQSLANFSDVRYLEYGPQGSKIMVKTQNPGFLFVSESWYPGWKAFVDGQKERILKANYAFRAVPVPAGEHIVEFIYSPQSFTIGKWLSLATAAALAALFVVSLKHDRHTRKSS